ncbi:hypothetical protein DTL21_08530 [Bremerella cremea]|uniref:Uncharacterized protein n=1 Tax=Blastopirellula marina TaxID=124 RepID=A0A2S8FUY6_9BACT|nr:MULTISPECIES: hypothetical protein [Pirellulaceae]PQO35963.1 hypothetical protein C5Y83_08525 [Blastopirellula marina]RCS48640.1 hypothetical protein DTL21_08530 [Bremerella cremea]
MDEINPFESPTTPEASDASAERGDAWLRITRPTQYQDYLRAYTIKVDGRHREKIRVNETITISVESGTLLVMASIDWAKAPPLLVIIQPGETVDLEVRGALRGWKIFLASYYVFFRPGKWLELRRVESAAVNDG